MEVRWGWTLPYLDRMESIKPNVLGNWKNMFSKILYFHFENYYRLELVRSLKGLKHMGALDWSLIPSRQWRVPLAPPKVIPHTTKTKVYVFIYTIFFISQANGLQYSCASVDFKVILRSAINYKLIKSYKLINYKYMKACRRLGGVWLLLVLWLCD